MRTSTDYHICLDALTQLLDTGGVSPDVGADPAALEAEYEAAVAALPR